MSNPEKTLTFIEHLEELRYRLIVSFAAWILATCISVPLSQPAIGLITHPLKSATTVPNAPKISLRMVPVAAGTPGQYQLLATLDHFTTKTTNLEQVQVDIVLPGGRGTRSIGEGSRTGTSFYYKGLTDPIMMFFKTAFILGLILAIPIWAYQLWAFIAPGLREREKQLVRPLLGLSAVLFPCGVVFAYFLLSLIIKVLLNFHIPNLAPLLDYGTYVRMAMKLMIAMGIVFELPVAILLLAQLGLVNTAMLRRYRRAAIVVIAFVSMIATPGADPISMIVMMIPLIGLYELSVWLTVFSRKWSEKQDAEDHA